VGTCEVGVAAPPCANRCANLGQMQKRSILRCVASPCGLSCTPAKLLPSPPLWHTYCGTPSHALCVVPHGYPRCNSRSCARGHVGRLSVGHMIRACGQSVLELPDRPTKKARADGATWQPESSEQNDPNARGIPISNYLAGDRSERLKSVNLGQQRRQTWKLRHG
jgi:hypothetical protein